MSLMDDTAALRAMAEEVPIAGLRQFQQNLLELNARLAGILGAQFGPHVELLDRANTAGIRLDSATVACGQFLEAIIDAAEVIEAAGS
jgi:hypothetical protein